MAASPKKNALGKGLAALLRETTRTQARPILAAQKPQDNHEQQEHNGINYVSLARLKPGKFQPRQSFDEDALAALAQSIMSSGMIQPILVRDLGEQGEHYEIIAGERRFRAAQQAKLHQVPVIIRQTSDQEALQLALIENLQRTELNAIEEALAFRQLRDDFGHDQSEIAATIGKSRSHVANMMRLLNLPDKVQKMIAANELSAGHARALIVAAEPEMLAEKIIREHLSVRAAEKLAAAAPRALLARALPQKTIIHDINTQDFIKNLSRKIGLSASLHKHKDGGGELRIRYRTLDQIEELAKKLTD